MYESILAEIQQEREKQVEEWGGPEHDDTHSLWDWIVFITKHVGKAVGPGSREFLDLRKYRYQMLRVAALAVAAIEYVDRNWDLDSESDN